MELINLTEALNWRYATKRMNGNKLSSEQINSILEAIRLSPSSRGIQPYRVFVIENSDLKTKIQPIADNQAQIIESSHLLVFAAWSNITAKQIDDFVQYAADQRGIPIEKLEKMKSMLVKEQLQMNPDELYQWSSKQIYLALGLAIAAAALNKIDATPMEGFNPKELDKLLDLEKQGLRSTVLLALGHRDTDNDWLVKLKKVRKTHEELFTNI